MHVNGFGGEHKRSASNRESYVTWHITNPKFVIVNEDGFFCRGNTPRLVRMSVDLRNSYRMRWTPFTDDVQ